MSFQEFTDYLAGLVNLSSNVTVQFIKTLAIIFVLWLIRFIAVRVVNKRVENTKAQYKWRKNLTYVAVFLGILLVGNVWFAGFGDIATFFGLLSAGLAIALKDPVSDLAGWLFLIWRKPLDVGDRIQIGDVKGDVIDIRIFKFTVLEIGNWVYADQSTGRVIHVPNHRIFSESLANYTSDFEFIWNELQVLITFESDWKKGKSLLQEIADKHLQDFVDDAQSQLQKATKSYLIHYRYLTPIVYTDVRESGINLTIRHLTDPRRRRSISQAMWEDILDAFEKDPALEFAYPTMRIYKHGEQGPDPDR